MLKRKFDVGFLLLSVYTLTSVFCVLYLSTDETNWNLNLWSFVYLFIVIVLFLRPFLLSKRIVLNDNLVVFRSFFKYFIILYFVCSLIDIYFNFSNFRDNIINGNWAELRRDLYAGEIKMYSNQLERLAKIFIQYLNPLAIIIFFICIINYKIKKVWLLLLLFAIILPNFMTAANTASRGLVFALGLGFLSAFVMFYSFFSKKTKKNIILSFLLFGVIFAIYSISVTTSRFGDGNESSSLLFYFGHSMLTFNFGLTDTIQYFGNGKFFFDLLVIKLKYAPINLDLLGTHLGTKFFTFVGSLYIDFGPTGTFILAILVPIFFSYKLKSSIGLADLFIIYVYINYLLMGVFVIGRGNFLSWFISFFIYKILKILKV